MTATPTFHTDWFTEHIPHLEKYLGHLKGVKNVKGLEIGCWEGRSSIWFLQNILTGDYARLTCVDNFAGNPENRLEGYEKDVRSIFEANIRAIGASERVNLIVNHSAKALQNLDHNNFDFVYVDGSHDPKDVLVDLVHSWLLLKRGGIMIMDDYPLNDPQTGAEPKPAIDAFSHVFKHEIIELHFDWQVVWRKV